MRFTEYWKDYVLLDASDGERLEKWGDIVLIRPDPQIIWKTEKKNPLWKNAHARYIRSSSGGGAWETYKKIPADWQIKYRDLTFAIKPMGFKHTGLFPEQAVNWDYFIELIRNAKRPIKVLNLFAYTGGATVACLSAGAHVTHVDASKGMTEWAKENAVLSGLRELPQRWIVDDCLKFIAREQRRGNTYDAVIMDPPSYGRGPNGEVWKLEEQVYTLVSECAKLLSDDPLFFAINSYTTGLSPSVMSYLLGTLVQPKYGGVLSCDEIGLKVESTGFALPCGATALWTKE